MSVIRSDGAGKPQTIDPEQEHQFPWSFTPDGKRLAFMELESVPHIDLWTVPLESDGTGLRAGKPEVFLQTPADERAPFLFSRRAMDGLRSDESGAIQVYVRAFPDKGGKWQISNSGGAYPMWSRNGHELFFETLDNHIMAAAYTVKGDSFVADKPRVWSEKQIAEHRRLSARNVDLAPDGKRIVALMPAETAEGQKAQNHVIFLENFFDEVRRRTATQAKSIQWSRGRTGFKPVCLSDATKVKTRQAEARPTTAPRRHRSDILAIARNSGELSNWISHDLVDVSSFSCWEGRKNIPWQGFEWNRLQPVRFSASHPKLTG